MKKLFALVLIGYLAIPASALAVEPSVTYMPLVSSKTFLDRVEFNTVKWIDAPAGGGVGPMLEATATACHVRRIQLARDFLTNPGQYRSAIAKHLVTQTVILSVGTLGTTGTDSFDSTATDAALFSAISASWSVFAACDVNNS